MIVADHSLLPKEIGLSQASLMLNFDSNYFFVVKTVSPEKFKYIAKFNKKNMYLAYLKYKEEQDAVKNEIADKLYELIDSKAISAFGRYLYRKGHWTNPNSFGSSVNATIFSIREGFHSHSTYLRYKKAFLLLDQFKMNTKELVREAKSNLEGLNDTEIRKISAIIHRDSRRGTVKSIFTEIKNISGRDLDAYISIPTEDMLLKFNKILKRRV